MANPFSKGWKYVMASFDQKIDENADPKVQIQQAVEGAKEQHRQISEHAAEIIGRKSQLEMQLNRLVESQKDYQDQTRRALEMAEKAEDPQTASEYNQAAEVVASQLVAVEKELEGLKAQHEAATKAAEQAKAQQQQSEARLKEQLAQVDQLLSQADQAAMQEKNAEALDSMNELTPDGSTPTLDGVRAKIEKRYADALGAQELHRATGGDRIQEIAAAGHDMAASSRLEEIRAEMAKNKELESGSADTAADALEAGTTDADAAGTAETAEDAEGGDAK
ncbi:PspA/IM30 family protein [Corynebacterium sp. FDAARGOS 1242]|uniref:PspA/IM30 family protein n=1 Tax=Corynebacterium sp. FDAARGOS 1242 TaxID=2778078 RepID=UPI00194FB65F|nr:PspA/IM30 family protein [Corynebacterium sp. FDAARGOS 1242]QRP97855.1 PspA/IM30 family protein [Corynebacterium sp. FDAARGOS 1242]